MNKTQDKDKDKKEKKDQPRSKDQDLKEKMRLRILVPIILGVLITSTVISFMVFYSAHQWILQVENDSLQVESRNLGSLVSSAGCVVQMLFQKVANDMLALNNILSQSLNGDLQLNPSVNSDSTYFIGAKQFSENTNNIMSQTPGFDSTINKTTLRSSWFVVGPPQSVNIFNNAGWSTLPPTYQAYYQKWLTLIPMMKTLLDSKIYLGIYSPYVKQEDGGLGFYTKYPLQASYYQYVNFVSPNGNEPFFTFTTRPYYLQATQSDVKVQTVEFIYPYKFITNNQMGYTVCTNVAIKPGERILLCMDYLSDTIQDFISTTAKQKNASYFVIEKATARIMMFPNVTSLLEQNITNITQAVFETNTLSTQEQFDFDSNFQNFLSTFNQNTNFAMNFTKGGSEYMVSLFLFQVQISNDPAIAPDQYAVGLVIPLAEIRAGFRVLEQNITKPIIIQIVILLGIVVSLFVFAHIMIGWVSKAITAPITKLVQLLRKIENPDDVEDEDKDEEKKSKRLEIILKWIPDIESLSIELAELHKRFTLIKKSFQYIKEAETALNDGEAIIKYSQALNIHKQLGNIRGIGMVNNSIANIHFKHGNYYEANRFYELAINTSRKELQEFAVFVNNRKKVSDESSVARVLKRSSSSNLFSTDLLDKVKAEFEETLSNRLYCQAQTMLAMEQRDEISNASTLIELLKEVVKLDNEGRRNPYRVILCQLDIAAINLAVPNGEKDVDIYLSEANKRLQIYEDDILQGYEDELSQDYRIPSSVLRQKYYCIKGRQLLKFGLRKEACKFFTDAIEHGRVYDPNVRQICLKHLEAVFYDFGILTKAPNLQKIMYTSNKKNKDIVLLLDYSQSMGEGKRINVAISNILKMFDKYIQANDRVGFIRFNMNCDIVFSIIEKKKNTIFLRKNIEESVKPYGGTALYNAIYEGLKMLNRAEPRNHAKWIVALTDGDDNESRIVYEQLEKKLKCSDVNLIIIGLELHESIKPKLSGLCRKTSNGLFIESTSNEDLNLAFQVISDIIYGSNANVEIITI